MISPTLQRATIQRLAEDTLARFASTIHVLSTPQAIAHIEKNAKSITAMYDTVLPPGKIKADDVVKAHRNYGKVNFLNDEIAHAISQLVGRHRNGQQPAPESDGNLKRHGLLPNGSGS